jgi:hypothetical protein
MNADHHFEIGKDHTVCEDYAASAAAETCAYAIVCDGCSSSPDVDFGARALALSAKRTLLNIGGGDMQYDLFGKVTIRNLEHIGDTIPLNPKALDATLLVAFVKDKNFKVHLFGDGVFFHKTATTLRIVHVDFESNKPAYLSYYLDKLRLKEYEDTVLESKHVLDISLYLNGDAGKDAIEVENYIKPFEPVTFEGLVEPGDILGVMSDGVNSFRKGDGSELGWAGIVQEMIDFKTTEGVFVNRRISAMKRKQAKDLITHGDDISMAAIVV